MGISTNFLELPGPRHSSKVTSGRKRPLLTLRLLKSPEFGADPGSPSSARASQALPVRPSARRGDPGSAGATARCGTAPARRPGPAPPPPATAGSPCGPRGRGSQPPPWRSRPTSAPRLAARVVYATPPLGRTGSSQEPTQRAPPGPWSLCRRCGRARETKTTKALRCLKGTGLLAGSVAYGDDDAEQELEAVRVLGTHSRLRARSTPQEL